MLRSKSQAMCHNKLFAVRKDRNLPHYSKVTQRGRLPQDLSLEKLCGIAISVLNSHKKEDNSYTITSSTGVAAASFSKVGQKKDNDPVWPGWPENNAK